jgi:hypothetical protein
MILGRVPRKLFAKGIRILKTLAEKINFDRRAQLYLKKEPATCRALEEHWERDGHNK